MKENLWLTLVTCLAYRVDEELRKAIEYLKEQVRADWIPRPELGYSTK